MLDNFSEELSSICATNDPGAADRVWEVTAAFFARNGFDRLIHVDTGPGHFALQTTLPDAWVARYKERGYAAIDPFLSHCCVTFRPISTGIAYADLHQGLSVAQMTLIDEASSFGINAGFSSTIRLKGDRGIAGWNIGSSLSRQEVDALRLHSEDQLRLAAQHAHEALDGARRQTSARLAPREVQCLRFLAQGYRTKDIARALDLSSAAIELYLRNARRKLGALTREQAIAIATAQGIIAP
ncbi:helix-turn-helix transcriptional regulator [Roseinatronobacter sp. NSM]|uniref:helix-turn-helix transcriptional regulator n=1 Tax=Roseinatronobacter sp. NSM TaxID=3457785 RepID=UPI0040366F88